MGIQGLTKLLGDKAEKCMKESKFDAYFGRKIAVDASMHIYQFLVVVGRVGGETLTAETGEVTAHLQGMFTRTARMLESGMKPVFVFDGKPPTLKKDELDKRLGRREEAEAALQQAMETGDTKDVEKYSKRTIKVTKDMNEDCKKLLRLMGVPVVESPGEAEAQCADMARQNLVYGVATEDMDTLTFGAPRLIRNLMTPQSQNKPVCEFSYQEMLDELDLTADQFIDLCILCGCDYCGTIRGIGPIRALQLIQKQKSIEAILDSLDRSKYPVPDPFPYKEARELFRQPETGDLEEIKTKLKWGLPDMDGLVQFLVNEKSFNEDRVRKTVERIKSARGKSSQQRLENFFGAITVKKGSSKRKDSDSKKGSSSSSSKKAKTSSKSR
eukprot:TRINITY_DN3641_c0_g1_i7.p1 TRINITY_DN3641_c0_g1~~TRINITY_DN3641_c0_g1_i7.p1  ORF type:complete len:384 (+),score=56.60 TRINITY_DN3641_c0_g1_i7:51-1202(+)